MRLTTAGHSAAATRAMAYFSETAAFSDRSSGIDYYRMLDDLDANFETKKENLKSKLKELMNVIFRQDAMVFSLTAEEEGLAGLEEKVTGLCEKLSLDKRTPSEETLAYGKLNEGFQTSAKIQYVTRAGNYREAGYDYTGALRILKVIIETCLLTDEEKIKMCELVTKAGAEFIKTSTGFSKAGATFADVKLMKEHVGPGVKVKAAGGISSFDDAEKFIELGADRLGTSRLVKIIKQGK